jgi:rhodanese-related sulfurtransferase
LPRDREIWTICAAGYRAAIAASVLEARGYRVAAVIQGVTDYLAGLNERPDAASADRAATSGDPSAGV